MACLDDLIDIISEHRSGRAVFLGHFRIAEDGPEDIVEIMGDAAGQGADGLHLLGLLKLGLHFFQIGNICGDLDPAQTAVSPLNGPVVIDIIPAGDRVLVMPDTDTGRVAIFVDQLIICAIFAGCQNCS